MFLLLFCLFVLCAPTGWAVVDDTKGDVHPNHDLYVVVGLCVVSSLIVALIHPVTSFLFDFFKSFFLSGMIYVSLFPYMINIVLYRRGVIKDKKWYNHLSETAWPDKTTFWQATPWYGRMFSAFILLSLALNIYFCPGRILAFGNCCLCVFLR